MSLKSIFALIGFAIVAIFFLTLGGLGGWTAHGVSDFVHKHHWFLFGHKQEADVQDEPKKPGHIVKTEQATTRATTRAFTGVERVAENMWQTHVRHKAEAATKPHPVKEGVHEIREGMGHVFNGIIHPQRKHPASTQPSTAPSSQPGE